MKNIYDYIEIALLILILDRSILLRKRYMLAIEFNKQDNKKYYWALWIYCKLPQAERYGINGGRRLFYINI